MKKEIIHPIFLKIASSMEDTFWKYIYEDLSYGKCPYGIYLQNDYICCFIKGKEFSYRIIEDKSEVLDDIHNLLKNRAGILSDKEKIQQKEDFFQKKTIQKKNINKKFLRENLIQNFILKEGKKYNIKLEHQKNLISFLYIAFLFKSITINDIQFEKSEIKSINGIEFSENKILIKKRLLQDNIQQTVINEDEKKTSLVQLWNTFLVDLKSFNS
jgi:hypothetical protein